MIFIGMFIGAIITIIVYALILANKPTEDEKLDCIEQLSYELDEANRQLKLKKDEIKRIAIAEMERDGKLKITLDTQNDHNRKKTV